MKMLSDKTRDIGDSWVIVSGRYAYAGQINQSLLSTTGIEEWAIDPLTTRGELT